MNQNLKFFLLGLFGLVLVGSLASVAGYAIYKNHRSGNPSDASSYGELAESLMVPAFKDVAFYLDSLNSSSPPASVKNLRDMLLRLRNLVDIFVFAYPTNCGPNGTDLYYPLRDDLDNGYTWIGNFKDLSDSGVNYTLKQEDELRNKCLQWKSTYLNHTSYYGYYVFISNPSTTTIFMRDRTSLSSFFWDLVSFTPSLNISGDGNLAMLSRGLLIGAVGRFQDFVNLQDIYVFNTSLQYHDYRKLVRAINSVTTFVGAGIYNQTFDCVQPSNTVLGNLFSSLGKIEDHIVAYRYYEQHNHTEQITKESQTITQMWSSQLLALATSHPEQNMACLLLALILPNAV